MGISHRLLWLSLFAVAMAQLEAAVVVYLRQLYYPEGFRFPLVIIAGRVAWIEIGRELATLLMLGAVARLAARDPWRRFGAFLFAFGVWDLFYYLWLKLFLDWPRTLLDDDILFLIPLPWVGPVLSAAIVAAVMVVSGVALERLRDVGRRPRVGRLGWGVVAGGALGLLAIWMREAPRILEGRAPSGFPWALYALALLPPCLVALRAGLRASQEGEEGPRQG